MLRRLGAAILKQAYRLIPTRFSEALIYQLTTWRASSLPPDESLRFLFRLDEKFYTLQGQQSVEHGNGVHSKHRHLRYHDFFVGRVSAGEKVLDVGCGIGAVAYDVARKAGAHVLGVDLNADSIAQARQNHHHPRVIYQVGDVLKDLPQERFDVVILSNVLEHLPNRPVFLRRLLEITRAPRILIRVPLFERDWRVPLKKELGVEWRLDPTHETEYTQETFHEEMTAAGLKVCHREVRWGEIWAEVKPDTA